VESWILDADGLGLATAKKYRKHAKRLSKRARRRLLQASVDALLKEGRIIASKGGLITKKTEILPYRPGTEWDLEHSLERLLATNTYRAPSYRDLVRRQLIRMRRCFIFLADKSYSLGPTIDYVALAVSLFAEAVQNEEYAVLLFDDSVKVLKPVLSDIAPSVVLEELLNVDCYGATDMNKVFEHARMQVQGSLQKSEAICVLISDCISTSGPDPIEAAGALPRLEVLLLTNDSIAIGTPCDRELARLPRVNVRKIHALNDIIDAVQDIVSYGSLDTR